MKENKIEASLYIVPTPIGNLEDITLRAINILQNVDIIACEDTRRCGMLIKNLNLQCSAKFESYFDYNEDSKSKHLINEIKNGKSVALISDAGTPCISDPGFRIVNMAIESNIKVIPLPGATAFVPALIVSGFAVHSFIFMGFPPQKKGRSTFLKDTLNATNTVILYESSHRINKLIQEIAMIDNSRNICISREISKIFEEQIRFNTSEFIAGNVKITEKGEFVIVIEGK
jgi:16S rRNA (cytidine1402-2'-O)-methyltransferase